MNRTKPRLFAATTLAAATAVSAAWALGVFGRNEPPPNPATTPHDIGHMVRIGGGAFQLGNRLYPDQSPVHQVVIGPLLIDEHEVTNGQFARFVAESGCITTAEQRGWSQVYDAKQEKWFECQDADWRHPGGPHTSIDLRDDYPVVHVSWYDATAYANWSGKRLPTEAEWEYAARSGLRDANYPWGREELIDGRHQANYRQHDAESAADGYELLAPVRSYPPSRFGLYDLSGNVWEWCSDWYGEDYYRESSRQNPSGPAKGEFRVQRGGSWLSPENYCFGHHVSTRGKRPPEETWQHVGFRCVTSSNTATFAP